MFGLNVTSTRFLNQTDIVYIVSLGGKFEFLELFTSIEERSMIDEDLTGLGFGEAVSKLTCGGNLQ